MKKTLYETSDGQVFERYTEAQDHAQQLPFSLSRLDPDDHIKIIQDEFCDDEDDLGWGWDNWKYEYSQRIEEESNENKSES